MRPSGASVMRLIVCQLVCVLHRYVLPSGDAIDGLISHMCDVTKVPVRWVGIVFPHKSS